MIHFVGAGPGAPDLITVRGMRLLNIADAVIYAGSLVNPALLDYAKPGCEIFNSAVMTLDEVLECCCAYTARAARAVRLQTGDPCVYGAIREKMDASLRRAYPLISAPACPAFAAQRSA
jgi:precorrin-4/cobalt-precorrin-4 C11-methyltransferase